MKHETARTKQAIIIWTQAYNNAKTRKERTRAERVVRSTVSEYRRYLLHNAATIEQARDCEKDIFAVMVEFGAPCHWGLI